MVVFHSPKTVSHEVGMVFYSKLSRANGCEGYVLSAGFDLRLSHFSLQKQGHAGCEDYVSHLGLISHHATFLSKSKDMLVAKVMFVSWV